MCFLRIKRKGVFSISEGFNFSKEIIDFFSSSEFGSEFLTLNLRFGKSRGKFRPNSELIFDQFPLVTYLPEKVGCMMKVRNFFFLKLKSPLFENGVELMD